jgi:hypothetical protein
MRIESKVRHLDRTVEHICGLLTEIMATQRRHTDRLDKIDGRLADVDLGRSTQDVRIDEIEAQLSRYTANMAAESCMEPIVRGLRGLGWDITIES